MAEPRFLKSNSPLLGELRDTLTKVTDADSLKTQLPKLEDITKQLAAAQAELNKQKITTEQQRAIREKFGKDLATLQKDLETQAERLDTLPAIDEKDRDRLPPLSPRPALESHSSL